MRSLQFANFLAANMDPAYEAIAAEVGRELERPVHYIPSQSSGSFNAGSIDVAFICGLPYVLLNQQKPASVELLAAPILCGDRYQAQPVYFSDIIVNRQSDYQHFSDLVGCLWAFNEEISYSGYRVVAHFLRQQQLGWDFFGQMIRAGSHQKAMSMVQAGTADAAAIDSQVLAVELQQRPELAEDVRVIDTIGPSPMPPIIAAGRLPSILKHDIRQVLLGLHQNQALRELFISGCIERFTEVDDGHYDAIRQVIA
jgi:phosphonate transport system substrate-binding protein